MEELRKISYADIKVSRTIQSLTSYGFSIEARTRINEKEVWLYLKSDENSFVFKVCGKSYYEYLLYEKDPMYYDPEIYEEFNSPDEIINDYIGVYKWLKLIGDEIARGVNAPENVNS